MPRAPKQPLIFQEKLKIPKEFLKFATPRDIANYRAERLKCNVLLEIGAGIGGQTIAFSRKCKKVIAIELDKERAKTLNENIKKLHIKNVEVIGDALNKSYYLCLVFSSILIPGFGIESCTLIVSNMKISIKLAAKVYLRALIIKTFATLTIEAIINIGTEFFACSGLVAK